MRWSERAWVQIPLSSTCSFVFCLFGKGRGNRFLVGGQLFFSFGVEWAGEGGMELWKLGQGLEQAELERSIVSEIR
jgi:hypothetical protein